MSAKAFNRLNGTGKQKCCVKGCTHTSIAGFVKGRGHCPYHWTAQVWGEDWADKSYPEFKAEPQAEPQTKTAQTEPQLYSVEFTDTFNGEANYCWVQRFVVRAASIKQAITRAKKHRYFSPLPKHALSDYGNDSARIDIKNANVCAFVDWLEPSEHDESRHGEIIN